MTELNLRARPLLRHFSLCGLNILQGSDHHVPLHAVDEFTGALIEQSLTHPSDLVVLPGDLFRTDNGEPSQREIGDLLRNFGRYYDSPILFVPGNHDLRGAGDAAWERFGPLPRHVIAPLEYPHVPIALSIGPVKLVIGNIFYDFEFVDSTMLGISEQTLRAFYVNELPDGKHLFGGNTHAFSEMADNLAGTIQPDVQILVTHSLPHPAFSRLRFAARNKVATQLEQEYGLIVECKPEEDEIRAAVWGMPSAAAFRDYWNMKALVMGSNVLNRPGFRTAPDGLVAIFGHNHYSADNHVRNIGIKSRVSHSSFQPTMRPGG